MKTIYLKRLKSGNYRVTDRKDYTRKASTKRELLSLWDLIYTGRPSIYDHKSRVFRQAAIIKAVYRLSQTYYDWSEFDKFYRDHK